MRHQSYLLNYRPCLRRCTLLFLLWILLLTPLTSCLDPDAKLPEGVLTSSSRSITAFSFFKTNNPTLASDVVATINHVTSTITATVPNATDASALIATFSTNAKSVSVDSVAQISGTTPNDFSNDVIYTLIAENGEKQNYTVKIISPSNKSLIAFSFLAENNPRLPIDVTATINQGSATIEAEIPLWTTSDLTNVNFKALVANFSYTGIQVTVNNKIQVNGTTANDFTKKM